MSVASFFGKMFGSSHPVNISGMTDWHSHILPGVDDGVEDLEDSLAILSRMEDMGIRKVWLTPHIMEDIPNTTEDLRSRFDELLTAYTGGIWLNLASENMIDALFAERLAARDLLPIGDNSDMLLVETSYFNPPVNLTETYERIKSAGFIPVIAHPERYNYIDSMSQYMEWKSIGVKFQLNILSLTGHYGLIAKNKAMDMLKNDMYDIAGSDLHHQAQTDRLQSISLPSDLIQKLGRLILTV